MRLHPRGAVALRGTCALSLVYACAALAWLELARPVVANSPSQMTFEDALLSLCAVGLSATAGWLAVAATVVVAEAVAHPVAEGPRGRFGSRICPLTVRRAILVTCGVALGAAFSAPAFAEATGPADHRATVAHAVPITGLAVPDRATGSIRAATRTSATPVTVRPGDSLWSIADRSRGGCATDAEVVAAWRAIYAHNLEVIGANPDLILPGTLLEMPAYLTIEREELR